MPPRIPEIEWRCEEDDAWYTVTIELINDNTTLRIHYPEFDIDYDEKYDLTYFGTKKGLKSRFRLASIQLQDHFCKQVVAKSRICACCSNDGEDNKFYDAIVKKVDVSDHRFPDGEEVCTCLFHIIWQAGPNDGKEMVLQCGNICLLNERDIETHPVLKMVLSLIGDGSSRSKAKTSGTNRRRQSTKNVGRKRLQDINEFSLPVSRVISCQCTNTTNEKTHNTGSDTAESTCLSVLKPEKKCTQEKIQSTADSVNFSGASVQERIDSCTDSYNNVLRWSDEKDERAIPQKDENNSLAVYPLEDHETELTTSYITSSEKETVSRHCSNNTCRITDGNILSLDRGKRQKLEASREGHIFRSNYLDDSYKLQDKIHAHKHFQPDNLCETMESERKCAVRKLSQQSSEDNILNCISGVTGNKDFTSEIMRHDSKGATEDTDHVIDPDSVRTHGKYQAYNYKDDPYKEKDTNQIHTCLQVNRLDSKKDITPSVKNSTEDDLNCECTVKGANGDILENTNNNKHVAIAECQYLCHQNSTKVIVIDNIEKDVGPFDVMDMLDAVVSGVQKVVMPPALSYEHFTKAFVFFKDDSSLVEAYDTLLGDFFIASSKGRPWVVLDPMKLEYKNDFIAFTAECSKGRRKSSRPLLSGALGIVPQDSPEYPRAEKMKKHYLEFRRQYVLLNKQVKFFEGQVTQKSS